VGVSNVTMHLAVAVRDSTIAEKDHKLMHRLGVLRSIIPERCRIIRVRQMRLWVTFLSVDEL
jgi:hypothetical protein